MQALGRVEDTISDNAIIVKPILINILWGLRRQSNTCYISTMDTKVVYSWQELGTSDFLVHYFNHALYTRTTDTKPNTCFMKLIYVGYLFG